MSVSLVTYERARSELARCVKVDEAKCIRDQAEALRAYGRQANDHELETWAAEIKLRANRRIGELSAQLEKTQGARSDKQLVPRNGTSSKLSTLAEAGIRSQQASRCEFIASIPAEARGRLPRPGAGPAVRRQRMVAGGAGGTAEQEVGEKRLHGLGDEAPPLRPVPCVLSYTVYERFLFTPQFHRGRLPPFLHHGYFTGCALADFWRSLSQLVIKILFCPAISPTASFRSISRVLSYQWYERFHFASPGSAGR